MYIFNWDLLVLDISLVCSYLVRQFLLISTFFWCHSSLCRLKHHRLTFVTVFFCFSSSLSSSRCHHCRHSFPPSPFLSVQSPYPLPLLHHVSLWDSIILQKMRTTLNLGRCCILVWSSRISDVCFLDFKCFCISDLGLYVSSTWIFPVLLYHQAKAMMFFIKIIYFYFMFLNVLNYCTSVFHTWA